MGMLRNTKMYYEHRLIYSSGVAQGQPWLSQGTLDVLVISFGIIWLGRTFSKASCHNLMVLGQTVSGNVNQLIDMCVLTW